MNLDATDRRLLNLLQGRLPLDLSPFVVLADITAMPLEELLTRLRKLKEIGIIRQISAIFESQRLGYDTTLAAIRVAPERLTEAAAVINRHPGVSHNYARNHEYNLWFTLAVSPESRLGLRETIARLAQQAGVESTLALPTLRRFKIGVQLDMTEGGERCFAQSPSQDSTPADSLLPAEPLSEEDKEAVRILQQDLPLVEYPFQVLCENTPFEDQVLLERACALLQRGVMRRFAAVLRHRRAGFQANGMGVWVVPEEQVEAVGTEMARHPSVSHCYQRPTYPDWPYSLFTMVHSRSAEQCGEVFGKLSEETGIRDYRVLFSTEEFKKTRVRYFTPDEAEWENAMLKGSPTSAGQAGEKASR